MPTEHILSLLIAERDKLSRAIEALQGPAKRRGCRIPALRHDPFEVMFANQPEEIASILIEMTGVKNTWVLVHYPAKNVLALHQWQRPEIPSIEHQDIEGVGNWLTTAA